MSLGMAVALGYCAAFGTLMPPIFDGVFVSNVLGTTSGQVILIGVAVVIHASHSCMTARGVRTPGVGMTTSRMMGVFRDDDRSRKEVLSLMGLG